MQPSTSDDDNDTSDLHKSDDEDDNTYLNTSDDYENTDLNTSDDDENTDLNTSETDWNKVIKESIAKAVEEANFRSVIVEALRPFMKINPPGTVPD